jgi:hypothetical protein
LVFATQRINYVLMYYNKVVSGKKNTRTKAFPKIINISQSCIRGHAVYKHLFSLPIAHIYVCGLVTIGHI